jgi:predicted RND superfamily exporter protein
LTTRGFFEALLTHRRLSIALILVFTAATGALAAARVRPDFAVEMMFPERDRGKQDYDRYKRDFPYDDAHPVVMVEAPDIFTPEGLARIAALEKDLSAITGVVDTDGLTTVRDIVAEGDAGMKVAKLFPRLDLPQAEIDRRRVVATTDPLFRWSLCPPSGEATIIRVSMEPKYAAKDTTRMQFLLDAREVLKKHERPGQRLVMSGMPVIRAEYTELILADMMRLMPIATVVIALLLFASFRTFSATAAAMLTIGAANIWTLGAGFAPLGYPVQLMSQLTPIVVMIISISDTVHITETYQHGLAEGMEHRDALIASMCDSVWPCFLTELVIALGFLGLVAQDVVMISQFGLVTAIGMMLTWLANMTVLPLLIFYLSPKKAEARDRELGPVTRALEAFLAWIDRTTRTRPGAVLVSAGLITVAGAASGARIGKEYFAYDDLHPDSPIHRSIKYLEEKTGGSLPFAVYIEPPAREVLLVGLDDAWTAKARAAFEAGTERTRLRRGEDAYRLHAVKDAAEALAFIRREGAHASAPRPHVVLARHDIAAAGEGALVAAVHEQETTRFTPVAVLHDIAPSEGRTAEQVERAVQDSLGGNEAAAVYSVREGESWRIAQALRLGEPMMEPEALALMGRVAAWIEKNVPEMRRLNNASDFWRKGHRIWVGDEEARRDPFPATRGGVAQEGLQFDEKLLRDYLSYDRATAALSGLMPDAGSSRVSAILATIVPELEREEKATGYKITASGLFAVADGTYRNLVGGLRDSLGFAILVSLATFSLVLRSWRLGLIALVPNVLPLVLTLGMMAALGIDLKPTSVICFCITLVIADDDTIQFLVRYRRRYLELVRRGVPSPHKVVSSETLEDTGVPMLLTACTVSIGFFTLMFSEFLALRNLGLLIGVSLFTAVFADIFLSPILMRFFRPSIAGGLSREEPGAVEPALPAEKEPAAP